LPKRTEHDAAMTEVINTKKLSGIPLPVHSPTRRLAMSALNRRSILARSRSAGATSAIPLSGAAFTHSAAIFELVRD